MIHFYHVTKRFDRYSTALTDITFHIEKGEFIFLTGPSGAGKSTLLKLILRQMRPTEGQIVVNGRNLNAVRKGRVFIADGSAYFSRPGPRIVDTLEMIASIIHPEVSPEAYLGRGVVRV